MQGINSPRFQVPGGSLGRALDVGWGTIGEGLVKETIEIRGGEERLVEEAGD